MIEMMVVMEMTMGIMMIVVMMMEMGAMIS